MAKLRITQTKSYSGAPEAHRRTLRALGLKHQRTVEQEDNAAIRGMLFQVRHMVKVEATEGQDDNG
ncbi:MAG TPA: 50S ribosomal protein L30 [Longimicrobium sp.]|uniref:50S ribosomal protein L30 n=1 Tax=Longimicrobium sp. TaxID=2029185 RepID=UPI002ED89158